MEVYETTILRPPAQINQSFCFLFCAVGTWSMKTSQFLPSIWILDGQAAISRC